MTPTEVRSLLDAMTRITLLAILALVFAMQISSAPNAHPDEYKHIRAAEYHLDHWLPPPIGEPGLFRSVYGTTYLEELDIAYLLYGRFAKALSPLPLDSPQRYRLFNLVLLSLMAAIVWWRHLDPAVLVFFATAQLWYVFAYVSGEALSVFLTSGCVVIAAAIRTRCRRGDRATWEFVALGLATGLLAISKASFYIFLVFLAAAMALEVLRARPELRRRLLRGLALASLVAVCVFGVRYGVDLSINGPDRITQVEQSRQQYADYQFKRGTPLEETYYGRFLKQKGVSVGELFTKWRWHVLSFQSFVGLYGYMDHPSSGFYYTAMGLLLSLLLVSILLLPVRAGEPNALPLAALLIVGVALTLGLSIGRSWISDFQGQGRYLFAIVPMLGTTISCSQALRRSNGVRAILLGCMLLSVYSFARFGVLALW